MKKIISTIISILIVLMGSINVFAYAHYDEGISPYYESIISTSSKANVVSPGTVKINSTVKCFDVCDISINIIIEQYYSGRWHEVDEISDTDTTDYLNINQSYTVEKNSKYRFTFVYEAGSDSKTEVKTVST